MAVRNLHRRGCRAGDLVGAVHLGEPQGANALCQRLVHGGGVAVGRHTGLSR